MEASNHNSNSNSNSNSTGPSSTIITNLQPHSAGSVTPQLIYHPGGAPVLTPSQMAGMTIAQGFPPQAVPAGFPTNVAAQYSFLPRKPSLGNITNLSFALKKKRVKWTPQLHELFMAALNKLGDKAVPSQILKEMKVQGLTRENVASHLQKHRTQMREEAQQAFLGSIGVHAFLPPGACFSAGVPVVAQVSPGAPCQPTQPRIVEEWEAQEFGVGVPASVVMSNMQQTYENQVVHHHHSNGQHFQAQQHFPPNGENLMEVTASTGSASPPSESPSPTNEYSSPNSSMGSERNQRHPPEYYIDCLIEGQGSPNGPHNGASLGAHSNGATPMNCDDIQNRILSVSQSNNVSITARDNCLRREESTAQNESNGFHRRCSEEDIQSMEGIVNGGSPVNSSPNNKSAEQCNAKREEVDQEAMNLDELSRHFSGTMVATPAMPPPTPISKCYSHDGQRYCYQCFHSRVTFSPTAQTTNE